MLDLKDKITGSIIFLYYPSKWIWESGYVYDQYSKVINEENLNNPLFYLWLEEYGKRSKNEFKRIRLRI